MKTDNYFTFQKFPDKESARELTDILEQHNIEYILEENSLNFDPTFSNSELTKEFCVKLKKENFEAADHLQLQISIEQLDKVDKDHYLFGFTDEELIEIVTRPDEWSKLDYLLAQKILKERGKEINPEVASTIKKQRLQDLGKPDEGQKSWIIMGYVLALCGGLIGIFIGHHLRYHKKTLPNGDRVYGYSKEDRGHGYNIFILGIVCMVLWTAIRILNLDK